MKLILRRLKEALAFGTCLSDAPHTRGLVEQNPALLAQFAHEQGQLRWVLGDSRPIDPGELLTRAVDPESGAEQFGRASLLVAGMRDSEGAIARMRQTPCPVQQLNEANMPLRESLKRVATLPIYDELEGPERHPLNLAMQDVLRSMEVTGIEQQSFRAQLREAGILDDQESN